MNNLQIIRLPAVMQMIGMSKPSVYAMIKQGKFPRQIKIGAKASGWVLSEIEQWISERINARSGQ